MHEYLARSKLETYTFMMAHCSSYTLTEINYCKTTIAYRLMTRPLFPVCTCQTNPGYGKISGSRNGVCIPGMEESGSKIDESRRGEIWIQNV
jgi:hypothetical protein